MLNLQWLPKAQPVPARAGALFVHSQMQGPQGTQTEEHWHYGQQGSAHPLSAPSVFTKNTPSKPAHCQTSALNDAQGLCCLQATGLAWNRRKGPQSQTTHTSKTKRTAALSRVPRAWLWQAGLCQELALTSQITASSEKEQGSLNQRVTVVLSKWASLPGQAENRGWKMLLAGALRVGRAGFTLLDG